MAGAEEYLVCAANVNGEVFIDISLLIKKIESPFDVSKIKGLSEVSVAAHVLFSIHFQEFYLIFSLSRQFSFSPLPFDRKYMLYDTFIGC